jgi:hypothetical protein
MIPRPAPPIDGQFLAFSQQKHEPYGEISASPSLSQRHNRGNRMVQGSHSSFEYGRGSQSLYAVSPSSYGKPSPQNTIRSSITTQGPRQYKYNTESLFVISTTLASILWWHESHIMIQIFLFVALVLYGLDLINARDTLAVAVWIAAFVLTIASGIGTLLLVDDEDASAGNTLVYFLQLAVEGMFFCLIVS